MRILIAIGVMVLIIGLGVGARFLIGGNGAPEDVAGVSVDTPEITEPRTPPEDSQSESASDGTSSQDTGSDTMSDSASVSPTPAQTAEEPDGPLKLTLPLDCTISGPEQDCYILSFVNANPFTEPRDFTCGALTYDEHRGTDFRLIDYVQMEQGVDVIAAAPGVVEVIRDGMPDANFRLFGRSAVTDRGRGNVVVLNHGNGLQTAYSHLRRESVTVRPGDTVARGQVLGQVGLSGLTEFPHVHFEVRENGIFIDPFTGGARHEGCGLQGESMWRDDIAAQLTYPRTLIMRTGFADEVLNRASVEYALFNDGPISVTATALVMHVYLAGIQPGDIFVAEIIDPDGQRFVKSGSQFDRYIMSRLFAIGRDQLTTPLKAGTYVGTFRYYRTTETGEEIEILSVEDTVEVQ